MAIDSRAVSVATTATRLDTASESDSVSGSAVALNNNGSATVYIGDSDVTTATGFPLAAGASISFNLDGPSDALYGIVASGTVEVRVLEVGV
jgi:hypothetical protein